MGTGSYNCKELVFPCTQKKVFAGWTGHFVGFGMYCHYLRRRDTKGSTCLLWDITAEKVGLCCYAVRITQNTYVKK